MLALCLYDAAGVTAKSEKAHTAGHFGEGVKVQINRLLAEGQCSSISYLTGRSKWEFKHITALHCDYETLHVDCTRLTAHHGHPSRDKECWEETICSVQGLMTTPAVDRSKYLFLQPQPSRLPQDKSAAPAEAS